MARPKVVNRSANQAARKTRAKTTIGNGIPRNLPLPRNAKVSARMAPVRPPVKTKARPRTIDSMPSVVIRGLIPTRAMSSELVNPTSGPTARPTAVAAQTFQPAPTSCAPATPASAPTAPTDTPQPPARVTNVINAPMTPMEAMLVPVLRNVGGAENDGHALFGQPVQDLVNLRLRADVHAPSGFIHDEDLGLRLEPLGENHLLLGSAAKKDDQLTDVRSPDAELLHPASGVRLFQPPVKNPPPGKP